MFCGSSIRIVPRTAATSQLTRQRCSIPYGRRLLYRRPSLRSRRWIDIQDLVKYEFLSNRSNVYYTYRPLLLALAFTTRVQLVHRWMLWGQSLHIGIVKGPQHPPLAFFSTVLAASASRLCFVAWMAVSRMLHNHGYIHFLRRRLQLRQPVRVRFFRPMPLSSWGLSPAEPVSLSMLFGW